MQLLRTVDNSAHLENLSLVFAVTVHVDLQRQSAELAPHRPERVAVKPPEPRGFAGDDRLVLVRMADERDAFDSTARGASKASSSLEQAVCVPRVPEHVEYFACVPPGYAPFERPPDALRQTASSRNPTIERDQQRGGCEAGCSAAAAPRRLCVRAAASPARRARAARIGGHEPSRDISRLRRFSILAARLDAASSACERQRAHLTATMQQALPQHLLAAAFRPPPIGAIRSTSRARGTDVHSRTSS